MAAWARFVMMIDYKAESAGRRLIKVEATRTNATLLKIWEYCTKGIE